MSQTIKLKRSAIAGKIPTTSSLDLGEVAINTVDGKVFLKRDNGTQSIQTILTTDSLTTGSISLTGDLAIAGGTIGAYNFNNPGDAFINDLTVTTLTETSTRILKENILDLESQNNIVEQLRPVTYTWKKSGEEDFGLIAEEVLEIAPHLVTKDKKGKVNGIKYSKLSVLLLEVVNKQSTLIEDLNRRITNLENERGT